MDNAADIARVFRLEITLGDFHLNVAAEDTAKRKTEHLASDSMGQKVLAAITKLSRELNGDQVAASASLDSRFDSDLGLDSLARTELILRLQREFDVNLPDRALTAATSRELIAELIAARPGTFDTTSIIELTELTPASRDVPQRAMSLNEVLTWHVEHHGERVHSNLYDNDGTLTSISYDLLYEKSRRVAGALQERKIGAGDTITIMLPTGTEYLYVFFGVLFAGAVPVPVYPPARLDQAIDHIRRHEGIITNAGSRLLVTDGSMASLSHLLKSELDTPLDIATAEDLLLHEPISPLLASDR